MQDSESLLSSNTFLDFPVKMVDLVVAKREEQGKVFVFSFFSFYREVASHVCEY